MHFSFSRIIEEPKQPLIMDSDGSAVMGTVGPFRLKQALILVCLVGTFSNMMPIIVVVRYFGKSEQTEKVYSYFTQYHKLIP